MAGKLHLSRDTPQRCHGKGNDQKAKSPLTGFQRELLHRVGTEVVLENPQQQNREWH
jgi:hypothetical protein